MVNIPASVTYNDKTYNVISIGQEAFVECSGLTSVTIPNSVTSIGSLAFYDCGSMISVSIPNSVTNIGRSAFYGCTGLTSVNIPDSVTSIDVGTFYRCNNLMSVTIPNSVISIGTWAFYQCTSLTSVTIGNSVTGIGEYAFSDCTGLASIVIEAENPPSLYGDVFGNDTLLQSIIVPCRKKEAYQSAAGWSNYASIIKYHPLDYKIVASPSEYGQVIVPVNACDSMIVIAIPNYGYHFVKWSDGNMENPRAIVLTQDTTFTAEFAIAKNGMCGKENTLKWTYEDKSKTLTINGTGELTENYTFGIEAPTQMKSLIIGNEVTSIGDSAFYGMTTINHLIIGGNVDSIGDYAFAECKNFDDITCYANTVPTITYYTFLNVGNKQYIYLFVPEDRVRAYKRDTYWGLFDIQTMGAKSTETTDVTVTPTETTVEVVWPAVSGAATYELVIKDKSGNIICTLIFNAQGQLTSIAFNAPGRNATQQTQSAGFSFTVTGLDSGTGYDLTMTSKNNDGATLKTETISFVTNGPQAIDNISETPTKATKLLRDGQIFILRGEKTYTLTGQEVR